MMQKSLNINLIKERLTEYGLNQAQLSKEIGVSRETVSQWFKNTIFPRPSKLLKLGKLLELSYNEIVKQEMKTEPIIAFRKVGSAKTKDKHIRRAKEMGYALERLVEYLPFEIITRPPELNNPQNNYEYIQKAARIIRERLNMNEIYVKAEDIIKSFKKFKTILIPVLLGSKKAHENALHIYLPESSTYWVYINLDTKVFDFKFWLIHELGHVLTPNLRNDEAEEFADNFAEAFLFPHKIAEITYSELRVRNSINSKINHVNNQAKKYVISPNTIYLGVNKYAENMGLTKIDLGDEFYARYNKFINSFNSVSENIFKINRPKVETYILTIEKEFDTIFFKLLKKLLEKEGGSSSFIRSVLNISILDAKEIYDYLVNGTIKNTN